MVLDGKEADDHAYAAANAAIIEQAQSVARATKEHKQRPLIALLVWEGTARPGNDATAGFGELAKAAGFGVESVLTL